MWTKRFSLHQSIHLDNSTASYQLFIVMQIRVITDLASFGVKFFCLSVF